MDPSTTHWNVNFLADLLLETSKLALSSQSSLQIFSKINRNMEEETYTNVDVEIEQRISDAFMNQSPQISIIGEEGVSEIVLDEIKKSLENETIIIDPIDGTNNYLNSLPNWAISIGRVKNFEFIDGAIVLPILGEMIISSDNKVFIAKEKKQCSEIDSFHFQSYKFHSLASNSHMCYSASSKIKGNTHKVHVDRSCVYGVFKVLTSSYFGYIGRANVWDYAACIGLFRNIGLPVYYYDKEANKISELPWIISEEHWIGYTYSRYPLIFTKSLEHARSILGK